VCYKNNKEYSNLNGEVKGLKLEFIENKGRFIFLEKSVLSYLKKNSKKIDILNLYIFSKFSFVYGIYYKILNPKGFLFLKLDGYNETFKEGNKIKNSLGEKFVKQKFPQIEDKIMYLPVGVNDLYLIDNFKNDIKSFDQKENIFLTVGRIGEKIKNNEMMLRALSQIDLKDWKMVFVGAINPEFQVFYNEWIKSFPHLKEKLIFIGEIKDRKVLYEWYNKSKVFCMTSWNESFCHSIGEALYFGNYIVGTNGIVSMYDLTDNEKYGIILNVDDDSAMAKKLQELIDYPNFLSNVFPNIVSYANQEFVWSKIVEKIYKRIENR